MTEMKIKRGKGRIFVSTFTKKHKVIISFLLATLAPVTLFTAIALNQPIEFDGGMNLQVARNLYREGTYTRSYEYVRTYVDDQMDASQWERHFPYEVQTNGPYIFAAVFGIALFGENQFGYQFANILAIFCISICVWLMLKRVSYFWATLAPLVTLLLLPASLTDTVGGMGEIPALCFAFFGMYLFTTALRAKKKKQVIGALASAFILLGLSVITKKYMIAYILPFLAATAYIAWLRKIDWKRALLSVLCLGIPVLLFEVYRLVALGSFSDYLKWWRSESGAIAYQSGAGGGNGIISKLTDGSLLDGVFEKASLIASFLNVSIPIFIIAIFLVAVTTATAVVIVYRKRDSRFVTTFRPHILLTAVLVLAGLMYITWWIVILPEDKTFPRRLYPGLLSLYVGLLLGCCIATKAIDLVRGLWWRRGVTIVLCIGVIGVLAITDRATSAFTTVVHKPKSERLQNYDSIAAYVRGVPGDYDIYGIGWWSLPTVSLMAQRDFHNLAYADVCDVKADKSILLWSPQAIAITGADRPSPLEGLRYKHIDTVGGFKVYSVSSSRVCK